MRGGCFSSCNWATSRPAGCRPETLREANDIVSNAIVPVNACNISADDHESHFSEGDTEIAETTRLKQQRLILDLCKYRNADAVVRRKLEVRAGQAAAMCGKPVYVFRELMHYLAEQRIGRSTCEALHPGSYCARATGRFTLRFRT